MKSIACSIQCPSKEKKKGEKLVSSRIRGRRDRQNTLIVAADKGCLPIVQLLMFAAGSDHSSIVKLLVENGAPKRHLGITNFSLY